MIDSVPVNKFSYLERWTIHFSRRDGHQSPAWLLMCKLYPYNYVVGKNTVGLGGKKLMDTEEARQKDRRRNYIEGAALYMPLFKKMFAAKLALIKWFHLIYYKFNPKKVS